MINAVVTYEDGRVSIHSSGVKNVGNTVPAGFYSAYVDRDGNMTIKEKIIEELHNPYRTKENEIVMSVIEGFFKEGMREKINSLGFIHKLACLLYGASGTGKTSLMNFIGKKLIVENNAVVLVCEDSNELQTSIAFAQSVREIQDTPIVFICDEFEKYAAENESMMKNLLDGSKSIQNSLFLAATNYIEKVPDTLKNRPSRFKVCLEIKGITDKKMMRRVVKNISNKIDPALFTKEEIDKIIAPLTSTTLDALKHICLDKAIDTIIPDKYKNSVRPSMGFNARREEEEENEEDTPGMGAEIFRISLSDMFKGKQPKEVSLQSNI